MSECTGKRDYIDRLKEALRNADAGEVERVITYYEEMIDDRIEDGMDERQAVATLESPDIVARELIKPSEPALTREDDLIKRVVRLTAQEVTRIRIRVQNQPVSVLPSEDGQVHLIYYERAECPATLTTENGVLRLTNMDEFNVIKNFFKHFVLTRSLQNPGVTLRLPSRMDGEIRVVTSCGQINMEQMLFSGEVSFTTSNAKIHLARVVCQESVTLVSSNASINLEDVRAQNELRAKTSNSGITAERADAMVFDVVTSNGRIELSRVNAKHALSAKSSNGRIGFTDIDAADVTIATSNSGISGEMARPREAYICEGSTSNSKCDMPSGGAQGASPLRVRTSNGSIHVTFA